MNLIEQTLFIEDELKELKQSLENQSKITIEKILLNARRNSELSKETKSNIKSSKNQVEKSFITESQLNEAIKTFENKVLLRKTTNTEKQTKASFLKEIFISWCKRSDVNGVAKIFEYDNVLIRFILFMILLISLAVTAWIMSWSVLEYLEYGVVSQIKIVYEQPTEFPAVTICDNAQFTTQQGIDMVNSFRSSECQNLQPNFGWLSDPNNCANQLAASKVTDPLYPEENRKNLGLNINQISSCWFNNFNECTNDLNWFWDYEFGHCLQFNVGLNGTKSFLEKQMTSIEGIDYGLQITISNFTNSNISKSGIYPGSGVKIVVHNRTLKPRLYSEGVYAEPGKVTMIGVKRTFVNNAPMPYTQCTDLSSYSSLLYDFILSKNRTYRQKDCFDLCIQLETIKQCGCFFTLYDNLDSNSRPCLSLNDFKCYENIYYSIDPVKCASEYCPLECESIQYDLYVSSLISPTLSDFNSLNISSSISYEEYRSQSLQINVYYSQLEYTFIRESPAISLASLIANLGGTMSLILSLSFFTIFELTELFLMLLHGLLMTRLKINV